MQTSNTQRQYRGSERQNSRLSHELQGKRKHSRGREGSGQRIIPTTKRQRLTNSTSPTGLCDECSSICWSGLDEWLDFTGIIQWRGKLVCAVGKRYRNIAADATCPLCRQLRAPWIEPFLRDQGLSQWKEKDFGDEIRIFRNLRHLPHVNDFPTSLKVMRIHNTPYHIAVVPVVRGWKFELRAHIAENGIVVVIPADNHLEAGIFAPKQVPKNFEPGAVSPWLKRCKHHQKLCNPKSPEVKGMKVIDCRRPDPVIRDYRHEYKYVALSYVWGPPVRTETQTTEERSGKLTLPVDSHLKTRPQILQPITTNPRYKPKQATSAMRKPAMAQRLTNSVKPLATTAGRQVNGLLKQLPKNIPLTIRDAIQVTKALGYDFLWVDKYCIDQNNEEEKQLQCSQMGNIYAGSQLTIFALGQDSNAGLPGVSGVPRLWQQQCTTIGQYKFIYTLPDPHHSVHHSPWSTRAWTYQEGLFSTRRLFFTDHQLYFECNAMNCAESFSSNLKHLHIQSGQRFRAFHRAGKFVCGNSNQFSHFEVKRSAANHRKVDIIRRCQYQTRQFTKRELTNKDDILNAYAGIAHFYAKTGAQIYSLAGIIIPFPIAQLQNIGQEYLDHLSYALAWTHRSRNGITHDVPKPEFRKGFPSWSWAGWVGEIGRRTDLPYCWTSQLSSVKIGFRGSDIEDYTWLYRRQPRKQYLLNRLATANVLHFDAHVLDVSNIGFWLRDPNKPSRLIPSYNIHMHMSMGPTDLEMVHQKLKTAQYECVVLGTYGEPRKNIFRAIKLADRKGPKAKNRRIELIERREPDALICLVVYTVKGISYRAGLLKINLNTAGAESWALGAKRSFVLR